MLGFYFNKKRSDFSHTGEQIGADYMFNQTGQVMSHDMTEDIDDGLPETENNKDKGFIDGTLVSLADEDLTSQTSSHTSRPETPASGTINKAVTSPTNTDDDDQLEQVSEWK